MEDLRQKLEAAKSDLEAEKRLLSQGKEDLQNEKTKNTKFEEMVQTKDNSLKSGN